MLFRCVGAAVTSYSEQAVVFECAGDRLVGITAVPEVAADIGVLILVGGPQYRVGSHRQFTLLARSLAEAGFASLRFDYRGMGDSEGKKSEFDDTEDDIAAAIDAFIRSAPGVSRVVLWGLCDAASSALIFAHRSQRQLFTTGQAGALLSSFAVNAKPVATFVVRANKAGPGFCRIGQRQCGLTWKVLAWPWLEECHAFVC